MCLKLCYRLSKINLVSLTGQYFKRNWTLEIACIKSTLSFPNFGTQLLIDSREVGNSNTVWLIFWEKERASVGLYGLIQWEEDRKVVSSLLSLSNQMKRLNNCPHSREGEVKRTFNSVQIHPLMRHGSLAQGGPTESKNDMQYWRSLHQTRTNNPSSPFYCACCGKKGSGRWDFACRRLFKRCNTQLHESDERDTRESENDALLPHGTVIQTDGKSDYH